jgi:threonine dehydratase
MIVSIDDVLAAQKRLSGIALRTPLVRLNTDDPNAEVFLKLENLQPIGSFKIRGSGNAMEAAGRAALSKGVITASAGNMAQGVAWNARRLGIPCTVIVPEHAPEAKTAAIKRLGGRIIKVAFDEWWNVLLTRECKGLEGLFIHPVADQNVIAGNGTIGLEILEDCPDVNTVLVPFGGGGLSCGIATAIRARKSDVKVYGCEVETAAPLRASLQAGRPVAITYTPSFVDGIGGKSMLPEMWEPARTLLHGSIVVTLQEVTVAIRLLMERNHVVAEGAGAASVAAALHAEARGRKVVCVVSGGNIDSSKLAEILMA